MDHLQGMDAGLADKASYSDIARKIFLTYPTKAFVGNEEQQYQILDKISRHFDVPITCVQVAGSAKTGRSFHKSRNFIPGTSDLDVAIIDSRLFIRYSEIVFLSSRGFSDLTKFSTRGGTSTYADYIHYLSRGLFRPDLMTVGAERAEWSNFFGKLSGDHTMLFRSITGCIYLSETFFVQKQRGTVKSFVDEKGAI